MAETFIARGNLVAGIDDSIAIYVEKAGQELYFDAKVRQTIEWLYNVGASVIKLFARRT
jgi:hypothetical protein